MKKFVLTALIIFTLIGRSFADEGMWLPLLLGQQVYNEMKAKGLKLTPEQLYSINKSSVKDAIIIFGGGCTGEVVSSSGLIFTNYHCGYDIVLSASKASGKDLLKEGYYAKSRSEEIPAEGLSVQFLLRIEDVTKEILDSLNDLTGIARMQKQSAVINAINKRLYDPSQNIEARVSSLFKGNQFLVFIYQRYKDIRLVGVPPENIGSFGGDTDNWEWPRHAGDFSVYRIYMSADGKPAGYAESNVPFKSKWFLPISLKGFKEGDFTMIYGYPGGTNRYESSFGVKQKTDIDNPAVIKLREMRMKFLMDEMKKDPALKLQLAAYYASTSNYWKFAKGEREQLLKTDVLSQKKAFEEKFTTWAKGKPDYQSLVADWGKAYDAWRPYSKNKMYMNEGIYASELIAFCAAWLLPVEAALVSPRSTGAEVRRLLDTANKIRKNFLMKENKTSDQNILAAVTKLYYEDIDPNQHPNGFYNTIRNSHGSLKEENTYRKFVSDIFSKTMIFDDAKWNQFVQRPDAVTLQSDPAFAYMSAFVNNFNGKYLPYLQQFNAKNNDFSRLYIKGIMEMDTVKAKKMYPDATFTMRLSYGNVKSYQPSEAIKYDYVTTSKGALEKYKPGDHEFNLPEKAVELLRKKDFGEYADKVRKDLVIDFITTNDITGGNSGSPVINANGELIGLAFDGNYDALSHKIVYDKNVNRTVCVDIRFVLWCIDKLGGAPHIIKELKIIK